MNNKKINNNKSSELTSLRNLELTNNFIDKNNNENNNYSYNYNVKYYNTNSNLENQQNNIGKF